MKCVEIYCDYLNKDATFVDWDYRLWMNDLTVYNKNNGYDVFNDYLCKFYNKKLGVVLYFKEFPTRDLLNRFVNVIDNIIKKINNSEDSSEHEIKVSNIFLRKVIEMIKMIYMERVMFKVS